MGRRSKGCTVKSKDHRGPLVLYMQGLDWVIQATPHVGRVLRVEFKFNILKFVCSEKEKKERLQKFVSRKAPYCSLA